MVTKADIDMLPVGTGSDELVKLDGSGRLPAVDASLLTGLTLNILEDVTITTPASGHVVYYNGTDFVNATTGATSGVQAHDTGLDDIAGLAATNGNFIVGDGANFVAESGAIARTSLGLGLSDSPTFTAVTATGISRGVAGTVSVFTDAGANSITIGGLTSTIVVAGNLQVDGTQTTVNSTSLTVTDKNIIVNDGGTTAGATLSGIDIEGDAEAIVGYFRSAATNSNLEFKAPAGSVLTLDINVDHEIELGSATTAEVIRYDGAKFINAALSLDDLSDAIITAVATGNILYYNGTDFVNEAPGATSGVQGHDTDLDDIAALTHTSGNVVKSDGTNWTSDTLAVEEIGDVVLTSTTVDQVLVFDGTNWVNDDPSGGDPLDHYFNSSNTVIDRTDLTSTVLTNAFQYTGTGGAVVTSIHVTNVDGTDEFEIDAIMNDGSTDFSIAKSIPIPAHTSLELLKQPKILTNLDRLKYKANGASKLQVVTTIAPFDENTLLFNDFTDINVDTEITAYTESNASGSVIESILLANDDSGTNGVEITVVINDGTNDTFLSFTMNIPQKATVELLEGPKFLPNTGTIKVTASDADRCDMTISGRKL